MANAPVGQPLRQAPIPSQKISRTSTALSSSSNASAPSSQAVVQTPHPLHRSRSISMIFLVPMFAPLPAAGTPATST